MNIKKLLEKDKEMKQSIERKTLEILDGGIHHKHQHHLLKAV
jgi:hypothetical protein